EVERKEWQTSRKQWQSTRKEREKAQRLQELKDKIRLEEEEKGKRILNHLER
ncbi:MAG: hypothetical protein JOZ06_09400, partial [Paludibacterium sp.]|nr:hypothetical protein [Paludibacterium sp.]